ncbi:Kinase, CMGC RCK [Giardia duodenalis]|uniref:Kinase, CMGC RCK n=1 Tax=Giardia intestinalis (strain ATCC 50803 / WB clone C6) TaxID=184922 RepID=A8BXS8_GIAIC|nr:Kinase, CMGC RCK [Giardia intestinalis]KAE8304615.1 Kinase, CMGC RCK [Giardia intestinalis]|eukprot:XP_001704281.1 Kinase, CMGC RCK [Giardia lamblia ATCC 50803]
MENYTVITELGSGNYGTVYKARENKKGTLVAIKHMKQKYKSWSECVTLKEVKSLIRMKEHPNIVKLMEVVRQKEDLYFVFEYINSGNLFDFVVQQRSAGIKISELVAKDLVRQILEGLEHIHRNNYMHRDLKCENILVSDDGTGTRCVKIADLGCAKSLLERPPHTVYVGTRWYRAVELFLKDSSYSAKNDIWACACILCEILLMKPLFPGANDIDMLNLITSTLGSPTREDWPAGYALAERIGYKFPRATQSRQEKLRYLFPNVTEDCINLLSRMFEFDQNKRLSAQDCLRHPWFVNTCPTTAAASASSSFVGTTGVGGDDASTEGLSVARNALQRATRATDLNLDLLNGGNPYAHGDILPSYAQKKAKTTKELIELDHNDELHDNNMLDMIDDMF